MKTSSPSPMAVGWHFQTGYVKNFACISETIRCRMLIISKDLGWECRYAVSWCDFGLTFDLAVVTLIFKILSGLYL